MTNPWILLGLVIFWLASMAVAFHGGGVYTESGWQKREAQINADTALKIESANKAVREEEHAKAKRLNEISGKLQGKLKEKDHALEIALNSIRTGERKLSIPIAACPAAGGNAESGTAAYSGGRTSSARAEISMEATQFLTGEASRADKIF